MQLGVPVYRDAFPFFSFWSCRLILIGQFCVCRVSFFLSMDYLGLSNRKYGILFIVVFIYLLLLMCVWHFELRTIK